MTNREALSAMFCIAGAVVMFIGLLVPHGDCPSCRILAPEGVARQTWLPSRAAGILSVIVAFVLGISIAVRKGASPFVAGLLTASGVFSVAAFAAFGILPGFPFGGPIGAGGVIGMIGGTFLLASGLIAGLERPPSQTTPDDHASG